MTKDPSYRLTFGFPKGWVQLPVLDSNKVLERDKALEAWAADQARAMLGHDSDKDGARQRAAELTRLTVGSRGRGSMYGLAFYPPGAAGLLAILDVKRVVPDRTYPELTFDVLQGLYAERSTETVGDIEIKQTDLPSGPALRVRSKRVEQADEQGQGLLMEAVTNAIRPPGLVDAVVATMSWTALQLGDELAEMADAIAQTIRVTPA
jgi:hypothetical protein